MDMEEMYAAIRTETRITKTKDTSGSFSPIPTDLIDGAFLQGMKVYGDSEEEATAIYEKFRISYKAESAEEYTVAADNITGTSYTLQGLTNGTYYDLLLEGYYNESWSTIAVGSAHPVESRASGSSTTPDAPKVWVSTNNHFMSLVLEAREGIKNFAMSYKISGSWSVQNPNIHRMVYNTGTVPNNSTEMLIQAKSGTKWSSSDTKFTLRILDSEYTDPFYVLSDNGCAIMSWSTCFGGCQGGFMSSREASADTDLASTTAFVISTGMPLRKIGAVRDVLDLEAGTVTKYINDRGDAVLETPTVLNLTNDEKAAWKKLRLYALPSLLQASIEQFASFTAETKYLSNATELGKAIESLQMQINALQA